MDGNNKKYKTIKVLIFYITILNSHLFKLHNDVTQKMLLQENIVGRDGKENFRTKKKDNLYSLQTIICNMKHII